MTDFSPKATLAQLAMPVEFEPKPFTKNFTGKDFVWIGGWGAVHKGLDLVIDAFEKLPHLTLHIFGSLTSETLIFKWAQEKISANKNMHYHGYAHYSSLGFQNIIKNCIGHVYPSAGENGCATLAQTAHYGLIPITTPTANNQANFLGYTIGGNDRESMIDSIRNSVETVALNSEAELRERSLQLMDFAQKRFTRQAFIDSFDGFLSEIKKPALIADSKRTSGVYAS